MYSAEKVFSKKRHILLLAGSLFLAMTFISGCVGYHIGPDELFTSEIKSVAIPIAEADTYRHGLGEQLTEAVCKKVSARTPFQIADSKHADSTLYIRLVSEKQYVSGLDAYNNTRQKNMSWTISARWVDRRGAFLAELDPTPLTSIGISMSEMEYLVAETGQSTATTQQEIVEKIADHIVGLMEEKW